MSSTWEVIVYSGQEWLRFPECVFTTRELAETAARKISISDAYVRSTAELNLAGLPEGPPPNVTSARVRR